MKKIFLNTRVELVFYSMLVIAFFVLYLIYNSQNLNISLQTPQSFVILLLGVIAFLLITLIVTLLRNAVLLNISRNETNFISKLLVNISEPVVVLDKNYCIKKWNAAAEKLYGYSFEEVQDKFVSDITRSGLLKADFQEKEKTLIEHGHMISESVHYRKDGSAFYVVMSTACILDKYGNVETIVTTIQDITIAKNEKEKLQHFTMQLSESFEKKTTELKILFEKIPDIFVALDKKFLFTYANQQACAQINKTLDEINGLSIWDIFSNTLITPMKSDLKEAMALGIYKSSRGFSATMNKWIQCEMYPTPDGLFVFVKDISKDISNHHLKELEIDNLYSILNNTSDIIWSIDRFFRLVTYNKNFEERVLQLSGHTVKPGDNVLEFAYNQEFLLKYRKTYERALQGEVFKIVEFANFNDRDQWIEVSFYPIRKLDKIIGLSCFSRDITEQIEKDITILNEKELSDSIINSLPNVFYMYNRKGKFIRWNANFETITGYTTDEIKNLSPIDFFSGEEKTKALERIQKIWNEDVPGQEFEITVKNGQKRSYFINSIKINYGGEKCILGIGVDVSEQKRMAEIIELNEKRFRSMLEHSQDAIVVMDEHLKPSFRTKSAELISGYTDSDTLELNMFDSIHAQDREHVKSVLSNILQHPGIPTSVMYRKLSKDGRNIYIEGTATNLLNDKTIKGILFNFRDSTARKNAEIALQKAESLFETLSKTTQDAVWDWNIKTDEVWWNENFYTLMGFDPTSNVPLLSEWIKKVHPDYRELVIQNLKEASENKKTYWEKELKYISFDGNYRTVLDRSYLIRDEKGEPLRVVGSFVDISKLKHTEEVLKESKANLKAIFENASEGFILFDIKGVIRSINNKAIEFGLLINPRPMEIGRSIFEYRAENRHHFLNELFGKVLHGESQKFDRSYISNNKRVWISYSLSPVYEDHIITGVIQSISDITERIEKEQELLEFNERFELIAKSVNDCIWDWDLKNNKVWWGESCFKMFGFDPYKPVPSLEEFLQTIHPDDRSKMGGKLQELLDKGITQWQHEIRFLKKPHTYGTLFERAFVIKDETGKPIRIVGSFIDITERKEYEETIKLSEEKYRILFDDNPISMWMRSMDTLRIIDVNKAACREYGYTKEEFLELGPYDLRSPDEILHFEDEFKTFNHKVRNRGLWKQRKKNGQFVLVDIDVQDIIINEKKIRIILAKDVTEKIKAENDLKNSFAQIRELASHLQHIREEERTAMAREIHDEFGQLLTAIKLDLSMLSKKMNQPEEILQHKVKEIIGIVESSISTVRKIASNLRPAILDHFGLVEALEWQSKEFEKRNNILCHFEIKSTTIPPFSEDIVNAIFRIYQESLTNVSRHAGATRVNASIEIIDNILILLIEDDGVGFEIDKIGHKKTLGLLGMRERVLMIGGQYSIDSKPGNGTRINITVQLGN